ncbi:MAG TPA: hypothetical protein VLS45_05900 [Methylomicrobium sp.]|nr:hypothetical protein [Methylomicrobium sp.]
MDNIDDFLQELLNIDITDEEPLEVDFDELLDNLVEGTRECRRCHVVLPDSTFADSTSTVCRPCSRRHRSALDQTFHEYALPTANANSSFDEYIFAHLTDFNDVLSHAIAAHR